MDKLSGKKMVILGLARQGKALAKFATEAGAQVVVSDLRSPEKLADDVAELDGLNIEFVLGEHPMRILENSDYLAISGGVPANAPFVEEARRRGVAITNDSQEFIQRTPSDVIGITGSAGKTTTTALTGVMAQMAGRRTWVGGNIGRPLIADLHKMEPDDVVVQELSSFQLEIWQQSPQIAAVLNITPNHLDRHGTMAAYAEAKANILRFQAADDIAVLSADDEGAMGLRELVCGRLRLFSATDAVEDGAFVRKGQVWLRDEEGVETAVFPLSDIQLRGDHNVLNVLAACVLADSIGIPVEAMQKAVRTFRGVEHRLELVRTLDGVDYINDSIATAPERALAALHAFDEPLILLAGGQDKKMMWDNWAAEVSQRCKQIVLFGELAELLETKLDGRANVVRVETMEEAVAAGRKTAVAGDIVLLSPGGTSFDAFKDFAQRGEQFRKIVNQF